MLRASTTVSVVGAVMAAAFAVATTAQAGGYAGNACVGKKQSALGKYTVSVGKAWAKYPTDATARGEAITKAFAKLDKTWGKEEAKAVKKGASCNESTSTSTEAATAVDGAISAISGEDFAAATGYIGDAMKARGKYIKDPTKDPGKLTLNAALATASSDNLAGANMTVTTAASTLEATLVELTTQAPDYPTSFQNIQPTVCASGTCGGTEQACTTNNDCNTITYGKAELTPGCVDGDPYIYFARRGTSNNVLMYYQGGGACWSLDSCFNIPPLGAPTNSICKRTATADDNPDLQSTGFANYDNPSNPFHDWSVVFVSYCTCDVHWGGQSKTYAGGGKVAHHYGRINASVAERFAREHFVDPDHVFVTGSSAGSYGAIMNSYWLMKDVWPNADFAVLGDAGVGVITQQFLDSYIDNWGVSKNFPEGLPGVELPVQNLSLVDLIDGLAQAYPNARFANYDSSYDGGGGSQSNFFQVMRHPTPQGSIISDWGNYQASTCDWNGCMRAFKEENSTRANARPAKNYHFFTGAGSRHTIFGSDKIYTETKSRKVSDDTPVRFVDWVQAMIDDSADWVDVDCKTGTDNCNLTQTCQGGTNAGGACTSNSDCPGTCQGGTNDGGACTSNSDCPGAGAFCPFCQKDPDSATAPYNNDGTVSCGVTSCPCGQAAGECFDGTNEGASCMTIDDCDGGTCSWVRCPSFTP